MPLANFSNLDFDQVKSTLQEYLKSNSNFTDYDFEGSNLSTILDVLAYNTYITSYNANMVTNEVFIDTATLRKNIVFTLPGEKFFDPTFGSKISAQLFENIDDISAAEIVNEIKESITNWEPRVDLIDVEVFPNYDNNAFDVNIVYEVVGADVPPQQLQFVLQSTR